MQKEGVDRICVRGPIPCCHEPPNGDELSSSTVATNTTSLKYGAALDDDEGVGVGRRQLSANEPIQLLLDNDNTIVRQ